MNDNASSDEQIQKRLTYLEALCRNIVKLEIEISLKTSDHEKD